MEGFRAEKDARAVALMAKTLPRSLEGACGRTGGESSSSGLKGGDSGRRACAIPLSQRPDADSVKTLSATPLMKLVACFSNPTWRLGLGRRTPSERFFSVLWRMNASHDHIVIT